MGGRGHNRHGPKRGGGGLLCPFHGGAGSPSNTTRPGPRSTSMPSATLIHPAIWPQETWAENWGLCPLFGNGELDTHLTQSPGLRPTSIWPQDMAKNWGLCPFGGGELGPHLTQCGQDRGLPVSEVSSWSVQLSGHSTPTSQTGQIDNGLIAQGEPFYKRSPKDWT